MDATGCEVATGIGRPCFSRSVPMDHADDEHRWQIRTATWRNHQEVQRAEQPVEKSVQQQNCDSNSRESAWQVGRTAFEPYLFRTGEANFIIFQPIRFALRIDVCLSHCCHPDRFMLFSTYYHNNAAGRHEMQVCCEL